MSDYDSVQFYQQYDEDKPKNLFNYDSSLVSSVDSINDWIDNTRLSMQEYLQKQIKVVRNTHMLFTCGNQIRYIAFYQMIHRAMEQLLQKYKKTYSRVAQPNFDLNSQINKLDLWLKQLINYLQLVQVNNVMNLYTELYQSKISEIYDKLRRITDYCVDLEVLWLTLLTPRSFREDEKQNLYKINYGAPLIYYEKQLQYLYQRIKRAQIKNFILLPKTDKQFLQSIALVINSQKLKQNLKNKVVSLLKGQHYALKEKKTLKQEFIISSLQMYNGQEVSELWDHEKYENFCIQTLKRSFTDSDYIVCTLFMEPENINFERRKRTLQFAQIYYAIVKNIVKLKQTKQMKQQQVQPKIKEQDKKTIQIPLKFLKQIMKPENIVLIGHLYVNFLISNKNAFSLNNPDLHKYLFGILQNVKHIYLSFGTDLWLTPNSILSALTNRFFSKFSQDIKNQITDLLPNMVKHLGEDKMPYQIKIEQTEQQGIKKYSYKKQLVSRSQALLTIFSYIKDAQFKDQDFYLDLPQVTPSNIQTAIMFIRSLQLKLRHHEPTQDQKNLWTMIIEQAVNTYKIKTNLRWFKPKKRLDVQERQAQFLIHKQIDQKWAFDIVQDALNYRDQFKYNQIVNNSNGNEKASAYNQVVDYFKYAIGIDIQISKWPQPIQNFEIFALIEKMRTLIDINFGDVVHLRPDQLVTLNQLHLFLMFYNKNITYAKGNEIYALIVYKIIIPWIQSNDKQACQQFQQNFHQFFSNFIIQDYYLTIGDSLIVNMEKLQQKKENLLFKLKFYMDMINFELVKKNQIQNNAQFLQKIYSVLHQKMDTKELITAILIIFKFIQHIPKLEDEYVSIGFIIDFLNDPKHIDQFLDELQNLSNTQKNKIITQFIKKMPDIINRFSLAQINKILKNYIDGQYDVNNPNKLLAILNDIPEEKNNLPILILKALLSQRDKQKQLQSLKDNPNAQKQLEQKTFAYWKKLQQYIVKNQVQRKSDQEQINLNLFAEVFENSVFKKIKQDYKHILKIELRRKISSKRSHLNKKSSASMSQSQKQNNQKQKHKQITITDKFKQAKIWRKLVRNFGTFEDIILFGQDPIELAGPQQDQIYQKCIKIIKQKTIQQKYLKRIIRKIPLLKKCAQDIVKQINNSKQQEQYIQPQLICKLIMINSKYRSELVQQFILSNIANVPIPIKIYQDYLALDIKRKLQNIPTNLIQRILFNKVDREEMKKIDEIFQEIIYLPIKKFQNIYLKFETKIEQNAEGENQEWETQSEGDKNGQDQLQQQTSPAQKSKKKSSRQIQKKQSSMKGYSMQQQSQQQINKGSQAGDVNLHNNDSQNEDIQDDQQQDYQSDDQQIEQSHTKIVDMFFKEHDASLPIYKNFIILRQQINLEFQDNYLNYQRLEEKVKADPQLEKKIFRVVDILQNQFKQLQIINEIINKLPQNLYKLLKTYGLTKNREQQKIQTYRKQVTKMPMFIKDYMSDRDQNSQNDQQDLFDDDVYDDQDSLSQEQHSLDDFEDGLGDGGLLYIISEDGHLEAINSEDLMKNQIQQDEQEEHITEQMKVVQKLQEQTDEALSLPNLKQINSQIEAQLTGKQLGQTQMLKILQISIIKLFSLYSYQLKQKPINSYFQELIKSKQGKIFIDTFLTILRVDQKYTQTQKFQLSKHLNDVQLSISKALSNFLYIAVDISTEESKDAKQFAQTIRDQVRQLLPIGDQIMIKSDIPVQDNFLSLLVLYSRFSQSNVHLKIKKLLTSLSQEQGKEYQLTKAKATLLTKHVYRNNNSSSIWSNIEQKFGVNIDSKVKFSSCLTVYGQLLRQDIEKCYKNLLQIAQTHPNQQKTLYDAKAQKLLLKQEQKKVEQNLRKHFKQIKHYYYWNKRNFMNQIQKEEQNKPYQLLKNKQLIKLTQLMIFYCHFLKKKFFQKIDGNAMRNLLVLPKSIIETSFLFLNKLDAKIDKWKPLSTVTQYFKSHKLYEHKFTRLQQVCNLVLQFLQMPQFSNSKFKQVIIPYFINNPENAHQIPLIFKLPDIPQQHNGQKLYLTRECSFDMAFYQLIAKSIIVEFHNEEGSDHGGMVRELMMGWNGIGIGEEYVFVGKLLAISFRKSIPYGGDFDISMAIAITQYKVSIQFFQQVDPQIAQSLKYIRDSDPSDLLMNFTISKQIMGEVKNYPLVPGGDQIYITNQNKAQYLELFLSKYFIIGREWEMAQICAGFFSIVNKKYAAIFHPLEMIQKIQGEQINDYMKLKDKTKYEQGYTQSSQMIRWFWQIVSQFNQKQMNKFLQFITGAPKVSIYNHNFSFVIEKPYSDNEHKLPVAHTCFNTLELPEYKTKEILEKKLKLAIYEGNDNFGIL